MAGVDFLKNLPIDKSVQVGVLDVRSNAIESPQTIAARIKKAVAAVSPDRLVLSTDCGMKPLARMVAKLKLSALAEGAALVRKEVAGA
jgi:5-methyltetrahydropteroyltriglutamate--homocysteine methyltransferase